MGSTGTVTIVVPVYNHSEYLEECLGSIVEQTVRDWRAVVVDDGSTIGDAGAVVRAAGDHRIRFVRHAQNRGLAAARNTGIREAGGQYVVPVDADDRLHPTYLATVLDAADGAPHDAVFTDFLAFGAWTGKLSYGVRDIETLLTTQWIPGPGTMFRRTLWEAVGGYCEADALRRGNEDWDFWLSAVEHGARVTHVPEALYLYRQHPGSMMDGLHYHDYLTREFIYRRHRALFDRYRMKNLFLIGGYVSSARAHWRERERRRAIQLGLRSFALSPADCLRVISRKARRRLRQSGMVIGRARCSEHGTRECGEW